MTDSLSAGRAALGTVRAAIPVHAFDAELWRIWHIKGKRFSVNDVQRSKCRACHAWSSSQTCACNPQVCTGGCLGLDCLTCCPVTSRGQLTEAGRLSGLYGIPLTTSRQEVAGSSSHWHALHRHLELGALRCRYASAAHVCFVGCVVLGSATIQLPMATA